MIEGFKSCNFTKIFPSKSLSQLVKVLAETFALSIYSIIIEPFKLHDEELIITSYFPAVVTVYVALVSPEMAIPSLYHW